MEEPDVDARSREGHVAAARLEGEDGAGGGGLAMAAAPEVGDGFGDGKMVCGAQERCLSTEEDEEKEKEKEKEGGFAVQSVESVEAIPAPFEGRGQIGEEKGSSLEDRTMDVDEEKRESFPVESGEYAESGNLRMCHVANGRLSNKTLCVTCGEAFCSKDVGCVHDTLDKSIEGSQYEQECLAGNQGDWVGGTEVETSIEDLQMVCEEAHRNDERLSNSMKHDSKRWPRGVDGVGFTTDANEQKQDDLMPKIEAEVSRPVREDSVPSVSVSIDVSLDGKAGRVGEISIDSVTCHVADGGLWNKGLCTLGEGYQSKDAGFMYDMVDKATEGSQCEQDSLVGEGGVLCDGLEVKTSLEDLQMCCKEPHCDNEGLPDSVKLGIQLLPDGMDVMRLKKDANHELEKDCLLPKNGADVSRPVHEDSVPSISGSYIAVSLDSKAGEIGEIPEHRIAMAKVACGSQGGGMLSCESWFWKEAPGDENQCSRMEVNTSEEHLQTCWMEACHDNGGLSDSGKHDTEKLPCGADGLRLMTDANHEDTFLPNIDAEVSWPLDEASVPSIYEKSTDVPLDGKASRVGEISGNRTCLEKLACDSLGGDMLSCEIGFRTEASGDENQHSTMVVSKGLASSVCEEANMEVPLQQTDKKYGTSEIPPERDLTSSSYNQPCKDEPCCSGRESSALCLGQQDAAGVESGYSDHFAQELNACNSAIDKPCSVEFVKNGNDGELQNQKSAPLIVFRRRNPRRAASSRNTNLEKHDQTNKPSNSTRKSQKVESSSSLLQSTMIKFPNKTTKGRSGINRPLKSSTWGCLQKLMDVFGQNCGPFTSNSHLNCLEQGRSNRRSDAKRQPSIQKSRSSRRSKNKFTAFSDVGYATDELNGQPTVSVTTDTNASSEGHVGNNPKLASHALVNVSDDACKTAQCTEGNHTLKLTSIQTDRQQLDRGLESVTQETCPACIHGECAISSSEPSLNNAGVGFSPDSVLEVASFTCENNTSASHDVVVRENLSDLGALTGGGLHTSALSTSDLGKNHASSAKDLEQRAKTVRGNENTRKEDISSSNAILDNDIGEGKVQALEKSNTARKSKNLGKQERQKKDGIKGKNMKNRSSTKNSSSEASKHRASSNDSSSLNPSELLLCTGPPKLGSCFEALTSATQDLGMHEHDSMQGPSVTDNEKSLRRKKKDNHRGKKGKVRDPHVKGKGKKKNIADDIFLDCGSFSLPSQLATDLAASHMNEQSNLSPATELAFKNSATISTELPRNAACKTDGASASPPLRAAWVCCDDCQKWRCIPAELADIIGETNCRWTCKDNCDKAFADCSIPQEKTNAEINAELELSDASADEADNDGSNSKASRAPSWTHVRSNLFLHRNRRTQSIDESMVCNCKPPQDGRMGCRDGCLNRMLNIECVKRTCPCGEHCSNQQFQRRNYAKLSWFHSGKKGYGLQLQEDVSEGRFLIEYVGEVLDIMAYESRQRYYASKGQKHFYFMALNGGEVIDACTKGNLGRFINHSCSPNCRTEKWMVNGEVCIGIFAMRNIRKDEELTFDYNYVRVSGAAPQKCFCGTAKCRGYIGGDISGADIIAQDDAEAEHFEPMAVDRDAEEVLGANRSCSHGIPDIVEHETFIQREDSNDSPFALPELEPHKQTSGTLFDISEPENSLEVLSPQDAEDVIRTPVHVSLTIESSLQQFPPYGTRSSELLQKTPNTMDESKAPNVMNGSTLSSDLGSILVPGFNASKKNNLKHYRNVKPSSSPIDNEHILGVEGRLNNLLDGDGGISKRKDATNGYLKLLLVTAAEGDNAGGTSKSVRDLSLILDALLKTKSRSVLLDIISKNGLQMLHNILKQNRNNFHRIPIIRKLLKVLEFLASKGILTSEHINCGPRCAGMESFRDSMLSLTRNSDTQVHQIARNFRDRWILRNIARSEPTEYPRASTSAQDIQGISAAAGSVSTSNCSTDWNFARRKRKSRWDYQPDDHYKMVGLKIQKVCSGHSELDLQTGLMRNKLQGNWGTSSHHNDVPVMGGSTEGADDEAPPGFESQQECQPAHASLDWGVAPGFCLERYQPNLSISYGIPVALVQHFGTPEVEGGQCCQKWKVAPGVPFNPFPPLPPYPRGSPCPSTSSTQMSQHDGTLAMKHNSSGYCGRTADRGGRVHRNWQNGQRTRWPYNYQGRRFPSNHHRFERCRLPMSQEHGDSGFRGRE